MAEKINGWTISKNGDMWQAVKDGIVGFQHHQKHHVTRWAAVNEGPLGKK